MFQLEKQNHSRALKLFERSINSPATLKTYSKGLKSFCEYASLSYDEIVKLDTEDLQTKLEDWVMDMTDKGGRRSTVRTALSGVEKFLRINRKLYYADPLHSLIKPDRTIGGGHQPYTTEDIQNMLGSTPKKRDKALIMFFASTGGRPQVLEDPVLRIKHLVEMPQGCYAIRLYDNSPEGYWAFLTPEARKALDDYLKSRKLNGETITEESPIFASYENNMTKNHHMTVIVAYEVLKKVLQGSEINRTKTGNRYDKAITYAFRKRFNTILKINNEVNSNIAEKLMAHKRGLDGTYLTPTREECFAEFQKAIPQLTISETSRLEAQIVKAKAEIASSKTVEKEIAEMRSEAKRLSEEYAGMREYSRQLELKLQELSDKINK